MSDLCPRCGSDQRRRNDVLETIPHSDAIDDTPYRALVEYECGCCGLSWAQWETRGGQDRTVPTSEGTATLKRTDLLNELAISLLLLPPSSDRHRLTPVRAMRLASWFAGIEPCGHV